MLWLLAYGQSPPVKPIRFGIFPLPEMYSTQVEELDRYFEAVPTERLLGQDKRALKYPFRLRILYLFVIQARQVIERGCQVLRQLPTVLPSNVFLDRERAL